REQAAFPVGSGLREFRPDRANLLLAQPQLEFHPSPRWIPSVRSALQVAHDISLLESPRASHAPSPAPSRTPTPSRTPSLTRSHRRWRHGPRLRAPHTQVIHVSGGQELSHYLANEPTRKACRCESLTGLRAARRQPCPPTKHQATLAAAGLPG